MSKVTSKLQVTIPKAIAQKYAIRPGDDLQWVEGADSVRLVRATTRETKDIESRLRLFDAATGRQRERNSRSTITQPESRGWSREELYDRGRTD